MAPRDLLLTGFGPFLDVDTNPSGELARHFDGRRIGALTVVGRVLPVSIARAPVVLEEALRRVSPALLVGLGTQREPNFRFETRARLPLHATKPDVDGFVPGAAPDPAGHEAHRTDLDVWSLASDLLARGVPARVSDEAGGYVCEWAYVHLARHGARLGVPALFVHVPQARAMALADQAAVLERVLARLAESVT
jgi:pyroglutamyl-peptidase